MRNKKLVAVVIPTHRVNFNNDENLAIKHINKYLYQYDRFFVTPRGTQVRKSTYPGYSFINFPKKYFLSWRGYNELLLKKEFYDKFRNYKFILIHQLDAIVFSNKLNYWCNKNYGFIAAPWFRPVIGTLSHKMGSSASGGNGGFSLRNVNSALKVLENAKRFEVRKSTNNTTRKIWFIKAVLSGKTHKRWLDAPAGNYPFAEDGFWSLEAPKYLKGYKVAPFKEAVKFAFEKYPEKCFKLNDNKLPFGVHAWKKYNPDFWKRYI